MLLINSELGNKKSGQNFQNLELSTLVESERIELISKLPILERLGDTIDKGNLFYPLFFTIQSIINRMK